VDTVTPDKFKIKHIPSLIVQAYYEMLDDKGFKMAAALSYYAAFSLGPLLIIVIAIAGFVFGEDAAKGQIFDEMKSLIGPDGAIMLETIVKGASDKTTGIFATIFSVILLVLGSVGVFVELQESLNIIWGVEPMPGRGIWGFIKTRLVSFSMVVATGFLLMISLVINSAIILLNAYVGEMFPALVPMAFIFNNAASFIVITLLFAMIYKVLPDVFISWRYVWLASLLTSALFVIGKYLIGLYLGSSSYSSTYGAAASLVVLFVWIYYSGLILFFGAEFTQVYRKRYSGVKLIAGGDGIIVPKVSDLLKTAIEEKSKRKSESTETICKDVVNIETDNIEQDNKDLKSKEVNSKKVYSMESRIKEIK
jgi:membrane protein